MILRTRYSDIMLSSSTCMWGEVFRSISCLARPGFLGEARRSTRPKFDFVSFVSFRFVSFHLFGVSFYSDQSSPKRCYNEAGSNNGRTQYLMTKTLSIFVNVNKYFVNVNKYFLNVNKYFLNDHPNL